MSDFYDQLAPFYHLVHEDWEASIDTQADFISHIIHTEWRPPVEAILDVSCGIGTQSIGLAARGFQVTASDLSPQSVARAQKKALARDLQVSFSVCDMRSLFDHHGGGFDIVLCAGNSIPHLLNDSDILLALHEMYTCLRSGGGCILTIRQYDQEPRGKGILKPFGVREVDNKRYIIFQVWDFEGDLYDFSKFFIEEDLRSGAIQSNVMRSKYYAISPNHLLDLMKQAGFEEVKRLDDQSSHPAILLGTT